MKTNTIINTLTLILGTFLMFLSTQAVAQSEGNYDPCEKVDLFTSGKTSYGKKVEDGYRQACSEKLAEVRKSKTTTREIAEFECAQNQWKHGGEYTQIRERSCKRLKVENFVNSPDYKSTTCNYRNPLVVHGEFDSVEYHITSSSIVTRLYYGKPATEITFTATLKTSSSQNTPSPYIRTPDGKNITNHTRKCSINGRKVQDAPIMKNGDDLICTIIVGVKDGNTPDAFALQMYHDKDQIPLKTEDCRDTTNGRKSLMTDEWTF